VKVWFAVGQKGIAMVYDTSLNFVFWSPTKVVFGENTALDVAIEVENLKCKKALIVTDKDLVKNTDIW
jgi:alcohol dehydrogenase YqhD (iron-dependent ADH family)